MTTLIRATPGLRAVSAERADVVLEVVAQSWTPTASDAWACVLADHSGAWYAAEVAYRGDRLVAYRITTHPDEAAARADARRRWHAESTHDPVRGYRTNEHGRRTTGGTED